MFSVELYWGRIANLLDVAADAIETLACNTKEKRHDKP